MCTTISQVDVISVGNRIADLIVGGQPIPVWLSVRAIDALSRNLIPLPVDPAFYATLRGEQRTEYLSAHVRGGVRHGRVLWHELDDGSHFLTIPILGGYLVEQAPRFPRNRYDAWSIR